jgi:6-pyruvoyltetrahydropterin/6-carboxytetrahydropterin synthase
VGRVIVRGDELIAEGPKTGMVADYADLAAPIQELVESHLDHYHLNDSTALLNPTSEELVRWIYERLAPRIPGLSAVVIEETCTSRCTYTP